MRYEDDIIEEVRRKNDIVEVISSVVRLKKTGSSYVGLCPFHNEKTPSFSVSPSRQFFHCFGCGKGGNVFSFVMQYENISFPEALSVLAERAGVALPQISYNAGANEKARKRTVLQEIQKAAGAYYYYRLRRPEGKEALDYLYQRGLTDETIRRFGLGYAGSEWNGLYGYLKQKEYSDELLMESGLFYADPGRGLLDKFRERVMFPIMDTGNRVIGFGGRVMTDAKPKYLNSPETMIFDKGRNLYGLNEARRSRAGHLILCEGYMDVIAMHQAGFTQAVASLGTSLTGGHASLLSRYTKDVLLLYDSDGAGIRAASRAIRILRDAGIQSKVVNLAPCKDPDEFIKTRGAQEFSERLAGAEDGFMFLVGLENTGVSPEDPQSLNRFFDRVAELILELEDPLEQNLYTQAVLQKYQAYRITEEELKKRIRAVAMKGTAVRSRPQPAPDPEDSRKARKESGSVQAQKLMLTWLVTWPQLFAIASRYLVPEDFPQPLYREAAGILFEQYREGEVNPARLLNAFPDPQDQNEVAALFHASIHLEEGQIGQAFADTLVVLAEEGMKQRSAAAEKSGTDDMQAAVKAVEDARRLEELKRSKKKLAEECSALLSQ